MLWDWFCTYSTSEEITSDGWPPINSYEYNSFLGDWDIKNVHHQHTTPEVMKSKIIGQNSQVDISRQH